MARKPRRLKVSLVRSGLSTRPFKILFGTVAKPFCHATSAPKTFLPAGGAKKRLLSPPPLGRVSSFSRTSLQMPKPSGTRRGGTRVLATPALLRPSGPFRAFGPVHPGTGAVARLRFTRLVRVLPPVPSAKSKIILPCFYHRSSSFFLGGVAASGRGAEFRGEPGFFHQEGMRKRPTADAFDCEISTFKHRKG